MEGNKMKKNSTLLCLIGLSALLAGCGGGGGGSSTPATTSISGVAAKGFIANGKIEVFTVSPTGTVGTTAVATGKTDANGEFSISMPQTSSPIVIRVSKLDATTTVFNEVTGESPVMPDNFSMRSFASSADSASVAVSINPFTELVVERAPTITTAAVSSANAWVNENMLGGAVDPFKVFPSKGSGASTAQKALYARLSEVAALTADPSCSGTDSDKIACAVNIVKNTVGNFPAASDGTLGAPTVDTAALTKLNSVDLNLFPSFSSSAIALGASAITKPTALARLSGGGAVPTPIKPVEALANDFVSDLLNTAKAYNRFLSTFEGKIEEISALPTAEDIGANYLIASVGKFCKYDENAQTFTCPSNVTWSEGKILQYASASDWALNLTGLPNNYSYSIDGPNAQSFRGTVSFDSSNKKVTLAGSVPAFLRTSTIPLTIRTGTLNLVVTASVISPSSLQEGQAVSGTYLSTYSVPASGTLKAYSKKEEASINTVYRKSLDTLDPSTGSLGVTFELDGSSFVGVVEGSAKVYELSTLNKARKVQPASLKLTGTLTLSTGETASGVITLLSDFSKVNFDAAPSSSNFGTGSTTADLKVFDKDKKNYAGVVLTATRSEYATGSLSLKVGLDPDSTKRYVEFKTSGPLDPSELTAKYLPSKIAESDTPADLTIGSSGGFTLAYQGSSKSGLVKDKDGNTVGEAKNGQLLVGGNVVSVTLD
jgi:hypothetical protein